MNKKKHAVAVQSTGGELRRRREFLALMRSSPVADDEALANLGLFLTRQTLSRILFMDFLYREALGVHGVIMEFGVRWGQNLALFCALRGAREPFNYTRTVIGFDTFEGFPCTDPEDGGAPHMRPGAYSVPRGYERYLDSVLSFHESQSPLAHIRKYRIVKGDAAVEAGRYLEENPETIIALAYFDLDLYAPTRACLEAIRGHLVKGSVLGFDELGSRHFPGETRAVKEALGLDRCRLKRVPWNPNTAYMVVGD
jgi:hypothetical protein